MSFQATRSDNNSPSMKDGNEDGDAKMSASGTIVEEESEGGSDDEKTDRHC